MHHIVVMPHWVCLCLYGRVKLETVKLVKPCEFEVTLVSLLIFDHGITTLDSFLFFVLLVFDIDLCHRVKMCHLLGLWLAADSKSVLVLDTRV